DRRSREAERDKLKDKDRKKALAEEKENENNKDKGAKLLKEFEDLQKGKELLKKFPPDKYGPKTISDAMEMGLRRQPVPADVREFAQEDTQKLCKLALDAQQAADAAK